MFENGYVGKDFLEYKESIFSCVVHANIELVGVSLESGAVTLLLFNKQPVLLHSSQN